MENIINIRDLGGLINKSGQLIVQGNLFRSGNPSVASQADREQLKCLALAEIIDFRSEQEKRDNERLFAQQFNWVAQPIFTGNISEILSGSSCRVQVVKCMCDIYKCFPTQFQKEFRYLLKRAEEGKKLLYHCTAGKDRTGFASFLLLSALGVEYEVIMEDYLLSNNAVIALKQQIADFIGDETVDVEALNAVLAVQPEYLESAIEVINKDYNGIQSYLTDSLAIDVKAIRSHYLMD